MSTIRKTLVCDQSNKSKEFSENSRSRKIINIICEGPGNLLQHRVHSLPQEGWVLHRPRGPLHPLEAGTLTATRGLGSPPPPRPPSPTWSRYTHCLKRVGFFTAPEAPYSHWKQVGRGRKEGLLDGNVCKEFLRNWNYHSLTYFFMFVTKASFLIFSARMGLEKIFYLLFSRRKCKYQSLFLLYSFYFIGHCIIDK